MKSNRIILLILSVNFLATLFFKTSFSQVNVTPNNNNYSSLSSAFTAINSGLHGNGSVTVTIQSDLNESTPSTLNGGVFTSCLIKPSGSRTISGNFDEAIIVFNGADFVSIDGLNTGGNSLTLTNSNTGLNPGSIRLSNGASNNIIKNLTCNGIGMGSTTGGRTIHVALSTSSIGNNNNIIENNIVNGGRRGIQTFGTAGLITNDNTIIRNNKVKNISSLGIFVGTQTINTTVSGNEIFMDAFVNTDAVCTAIHIQGIGVVDITRNRIYNYSGASNSFNGVNAIPLLLSSPGSNSTTLNIVNNMISFTNNNPSTTEIFGIALRSILNGTTAYNSNVYYNSIYISGTAPVNTSLTAGLFINNDAPPVANANVKNNIFINTRIGGGSGTRNTASMLIPQPNSTISADYNVYYTADSVNGFQAGWNNTGYSNINYYKQAACNPSINELHTLFSSSFSFVSSTNLHLIDSTVMDGIVGTPIGGITTDIDGAVRNSSFPYRGADELPDSFPVLNLGLSVQGVGTSGNEIIYAGIVDGAPDYDILAVSTEVMYTSISAQGVPVVMRFGPGALAAMARFGPLFGLVVFDPHALSTFTLPCGVANLGWICFPPFTSFVPTANYDFTTSVSQAYGNNQIIYNGVPSIYNGDVDQNGFIDLSDVLSIYNDATNFVTGNYLINDLNDDGSVDLTDLLIAYNNSVNFVSVIGPSIVNRESSIVNCESSIVNGQWSIVNGQ